jgi:phosphoglycolate phosphatase-like HAD superfamily hydrolase
LKRPVLFLDDGGVINDNEVRARQWQRLVAEFFVPRLGGNSEAWAQANWIVINEILSPEAWRERMLAHPDYESFDYHYQLDWLTRMCELVGVPRPPEEESVALGRECSTWVIPQIRSAVPGVADAVRLLHERGYTLHMASGASSWDLAPYLEGAGVLACFSRLYGPDLVNVFKVGPEFYRSIFDDAGVAPTDALVIDDNPLVAPWVAEAGGRVIIVGPQGAAAGPDVLATLDSLAALPSFLERTADLQLTGS